MACVIAFIRDWIPKFGVPSTGTSDNGSTFVSQIWQGLNEQLGVEVYFTPLTIAPSVAMIGISLFSNASNLAQDQWGIAIGTIFFIILLSQYLKDLPFPFLGLVSYKDNTGKNKWRLGCEKYYVIRLFPVS